VNRNEEKDEVDTITDVGGQNNAVVRPREATTETRMPNIAAAVNIDDCVCKWPDGCMCSAAEKALYQFNAGTQPPMTKVQREECLKEIDQVEGYSRAEYENESDASLAIGVIYAWTDYARDKGLL
jgi:hypothetical protein